MRFAAAVLLALCASCAPIPRPGVLEEVDRTRTSATSEDARLHAPQAYLAADKLRADAEAANESGDRAGAEILGEQALAAYAHAAALARVATAEARRAAAAHRGDAVARELATVEEQQRRVAAEAADIEMRVRVTRDALPLSPSEPSTPDRERARLVAAKSLLVQARLLCVATEMLAPSSARLAEAWAAIAALEATLARVPQRTPIDDAARLRSLCLSELTAARRPATRAAPETGAPDSLFAELAEAGLEPVRDDRGVVVVLRDVFQGVALAPPAEARVSSLGQVARAHADFPVVVVLHTARGASTPRETARGNAVATALTKGGAVRVKVELAGDALPIAPSKLAGATRRNERTEIVFVAPTL